MLHNRNNKLINKKLSSKKTHSKFKYWVALFLFVTSVFSTLPILSVDALTTSDSDPRGYNNQIKSILYYKAINYCLKNAELSTDPWFAGESIKLADAESGKWFGSGKSVAIGLYMKDSIINNMDNRGFTGCDNTSLISNALVFWNTNPAETLCNSGFKREGIKTTGDNNKDISDCINGGNASFVMDGDRNNSADKFTDFIKKKVYEGKDIPSLSSSQLYVYYLHSLDQSCVTGIGGVPGIDSGSYLSPDPDKTYEKNYEKALKEVLWVNTTKSLATIDKGSYPSSLNINTYNLAAEPNDITVYGSLKKSSCYSIAKAMSDNADDYQATYNKWAEENKTDAAKVTAVAGSQTEGLTKETNSKSSCAIDGIGWIVCPVLTFLGNISDAAFNFLAASFLETEINLVSTDGATYQAWSAMRSIANIAFVIVFLIIIFSQITSVGITNYGIKKMLPRLIIAAILVNVSFFICQIAIDLSNILGYSLKNLFDSFPNLMETTSTMKDASDSSSLAIGGKIIDIIAGGGLVVGGAIFLALAVSVPVLLAVLLALLMTVLILVARTALIVLLVVVSPLAFVAFLLPNTEQWFEKWKKMFMGLLLVFPIISILFGAGSLAALVINDAAGKDNMMMQLVAVGVAVLPLFAVPSLLKGSMNAAGSIGTKLSGWSDKANGRIGGKVSDTSRAGQYMKYRTSEASRKRALIQSGRYTGRDPLGRLSSKANSAFNESRISGQFGDRSASTGIALANKLDDESVSNKAAMIFAEGGPLNSMSLAETKLKSAISNGDVIGARAAQSVLLKSGGAGRNSLRNILKNTTPTDSNSSVLNNLRGDILTSGVKSNDAILGKWGSSGQSISDLEQDAGTFSGLTPEELAGQDLKAVMAAEGKGISNETIQAMLSNPNSSKMLNTEKLEFYSQPTAEKRSEFAQNWTAQEEAKKANQQQKTS